MCVVYTFGGQVEELKMRVSILAPNGRLLAEKVEVVLKVVDRGLSGRFFSGFFARLPEIPFEKGDKFQMLFRDEDAKESGVDNLLKALAFPKGEIVDFRPCPPDKW